ncbi:MAG: hypothetical protein ACOC85_01470 [Thermoplasmatota archaeon]
MKENKEICITGLLLGDANSSEKANEISNLFENCPYKIVNTTFDKYLILVFSIPKSHKWWLEGIKNDPKNTLGLKNVDVLFTDKIMLKGSVKNHKIESETKEHPCGSDCSQCPMYLGRCDGCPKSSFYKD